MALTLARVVETFTFVCGSTHICFNFRLLSEARLSRLYPSPLISQLDMPRAYFSTDLLLTLHISLVNLICWGFFNLNSVRLLKISGSPKKIPKMGFKMQSQFLRALCGREDLSVSTGLWTDSIMVVVRDESLNDVRRYYLFAVCITSHLH